MQAFLLPSAVQCLDTIVGKIENGLERGFVKHCLNCLLITDPTSCELAKPSQENISLLFYFFPSTESLILY